MGGGVYAQWGEEEGWWVLLSLERARFPRHSCFCDRHAILQRLTCFIYAASASIFLVFIAGMASGVSLSTRQTRIFLFFLCLYFPEGFFGEKEVYMDRQSGVDIIE